MPQSDKYPCLTLLLTPATQAGFASLLQYGVLFPLTAWKDPFWAGFEGVEYPQTVQGLLAVHF